MSSAELLTGNFDPIKMARRDKRKTLSIEKVKL